MKYGRNSRSSMKRNHPRWRKLLLVVTAVLVLTGSTGCRTTEPQPVQDNTYTEVLLGMIPELPEVPAFPTLHWTYSDGLYSIDEEDVDKLLDYGENRLPRFRWELEQYERSLSVVLSAMTVDYDRN